MAKKILLLVLLVMTAVNSNITAAATLEPTALKCEYRVNPLGIDANPPRLSWILESSDRGQKQTAYRVLVASNEEKLKGNQGDLWDSKKISSDQSVHVVYAGHPLRSRMRCHWKTRVWDKDGKVSAWSQPALWSMGLLKRTDWKAKWICFDTAPFNEDPELHLPPSPYLRKEFKVNRKIRRATVYVSALGLFELFINGHRVGRDHFTPGWTNYRKRVYYLTYDVTDLLKDGDNAIGAILANGWYAGYVGFDPMHKKRARDRAFYGQTPALLAQLEIECEDGKIQIVATDENWKASTGPIRKTDILMGETYDARLEMPGWDRPGFDDQAWKIVTLMDAAKCKIEAYPGVTVQVTQEIRPIEITKPKEGVYVLNMGQNFAGRVRLKVKGKAGTKVVLRFAEMLHKDGSIMTENLRRARCTDTYIFRGNGKDEIWEPRFTYHGFQYVELTGYPGKPDLGAITGIVLHSAAPVAGSFECSNAVVNKLYSNITWTQRANFFDIPTDCPQRDERLGWTGDAQIYIRSATYNMDVAAFFKKWLVNLEDDQRPSGAFPDFAPLPYLQYEPSPGWMDAGVICPFTIYQVYGDTHVIEHHYEAMTKFMHFLLRTSNDYLRSPRGHCWGDWLSIGGRTSNDLIATAYFAYDAKLMAEMAAAIGRMEDAQRYARLFDNIKTAFNKAYVSANGRIKGDTQTCYALALYMDLLPQALKEKAGARLVELIRERNWHLSTGFLGVKYLLPALTEEGYVDVAFRLLTNKTYPSWGYSIENGATTIWERWNSYKKGKGFQDSYMNSFNHYAFGSVCEWMFASMAGIDTDGAGFKRITIRPQPGGSGITYTKASYDSIYGRIATYWRVRDGKFLLDLTIPANTTATVYIPARDADSITEGGKPASKAEAVRFLRIGDGRAVFAVGSGRYRFMSSLPTARQVDETK